MKVLLDECVDQRLAVEIVGHEVRTVPEMGWANLKNGQLLTLAQEDFDAFVTVDGNLPFQQNLPKYDIAVVVLKAKSNRLADLQPLVPKLLESLPIAPSGNVCHPVVRRHQQVSKRLRPGSPSRAAASTWCQAD